MENHGSGAGSAYQSSNPPVAPATPEYRSQSMDAALASASAFTEAQEERLDEESEKFENTASAMVSGAEAYERSVHPIKSRIRGFLRKFGTLICKITIYICLAGFFVDAIRLFLGMILLRPSFCRPTPWMLLWLPPLILVLLFGNLSQSFNYDRPKKIAFYTLCGHMLLSLVRCVYALSFAIGMYFWAWIPVHPLLPSRFVWFFAMYWIAFPAIVVGAQTLSYLSKNVLADLHWVLDFRMSEIHDFRSNKEEAYDAHYIHDSNSSKEVPILEIDRYLHTLVIGATGTGKTALIANNMVRDDINKRCDNEDTLRKCLEEMVEGHRATIVRRIEKEMDWRPEDVQPEPGHESEYFYYLFKYRTCGYTLVAPDNALSDNIYKMCLELDIPVNRIEPSFLPDGSRAHGWTGFNPLYISPSIPSWMRKDEIVRRATLVADVIGAINRGTGSDVYFETVNRSVTICVLVELLFGFEYVHPERSCPTLEDFLYLLNDFSRIAVYNDAVRKHETSGIFNSYIDFVTKDMLAGYSSEKSRLDKSGLYVQARGLRFNVQSLLNNRPFRDVLCAPVSMDIDRALAQGEITLVNYAYAEGEIDAAVFAGFFLRCFFDSVYRRPGSEKTRIPHFLVNDEASITLESVGAAYERAAVLFRKYRVSMTLMMQSLAQLDKNDETKYAKSVLLSSCSTQIVFGRISPEEMKLYSELGGTKDVTKEQHTETSTALTVENPTASFGTREMVTEEEVLKGGSVRYQKFQKYTVFTVRNGSPLYPFIGMSEFRDEKKDYKRKRYASHFAELSANGLPGEVSAKARETIEQNAALAVQNEEFIPLADITNEQYQAMSKVDLNELLGDLPSSEVSTTNDSAAAEPEAKDDKAETINGYTVNDVKDEIFDEPEGGTNG